MNLKQEKANRIKYLLEVYNEAKTYVPTAPTSAIFGLSKYRKYNLRTKEYTNDDTERGGYLLGERIGLSEQEVESIVYYCSSREVGYLSSALGMQRFQLTISGINYLESLEEISSLAPIQMNTINIRDVNAPLQFQQNTQKSEQHQTITYSKEDISSFFQALRNDIVPLDDSVKQDFESEIVYAEKQLVKGKDIKNQLDNIIGLIQSIGINVFANVCASPISTFINPLLGFK
jgi:hypothetical protein